MNNEEPIMDDMTLAPEPDFLSEPQASDVETVAPTSNEAGIFQRADGRVIESLVLHELERDALPTSPNACQVCPNSMWMHQDDNGEMVLQNYCLIMSRIIWQANKPVEILNCDGLVMNQDE